MAHDCSSPLLLPSRRNMATIFLLASEAKSVLQLCSTLERCGTPQTPAPYGAGIVLLCGRHAHARAALAADGDTLLVALPHDAKATQSVPLSSVLDDFPTDEQWAHVEAEACGRALRGEAPPLTLQQVRDTCVRLAGLQRCLILVTQAAAAFPTTACAGTAASAKPADSCRSLSMSPRELESVLRANPQLQQQVAQLLQHPEVDEAAWRELQAGLEPWDLEAAKKLAGPEFDRGPSHGQRVDTARQGQEPDQQQRQRQGPGGRRKPPSEVAVNGAGPGGSGGDVPATSWAPDTPAVAHDRGTADWGAGTMAAHSQGLAGREPSARGAQGAGRAVMAGEQVNGKGAVDTTVSGRGSQRASGAPGQAAAAGAAAAGRAADRIEAEGRTALREDRGSGGGKARLEGDGRRRGDSRELPREQERSHRREREREREREPKCDGMGGREGLPGRASTDGKEDKEAAKGKREREPDKERETRREPDGERGREAAQGQREKRGRTEPVRGKESERDKRDRVPVEERLDREAKREREPGRDRGSELDRDGGTRDRDAGRDRQGALEARASATEARGGEQRDRDAGQDRQGALESRGSATEARGGEQRDRDAGQDRQGALESRGSATEARGGEQQDRDAGRDRQGALESRGSATEARGGGQQLPPPPPRPPAALRPLTEEAETAEQWARRVHAYLMQCQDRSCPLVELRRVGLAIPARFLHPPGLRPIAPSTFLYKFSNLWNLSPHNSGPIHLIAIPLREDARDSGSPRGPPSPHTRGPHGFRDPGRSGPDPGWRERPRSSSQDRGRSRSRSRERTGY